MNRNKLFALALIAAVGLATLGGSMAIAEPAKETKPAGGQAGHPADMKLPPGWTESDMQACMAAGTPGKMHERLAKTVGVWQGKNTMWMYPGAEPATSESTTTITAIMDGRYVKVEAAGDMPGMGPFSGFGINGFDNVTQKFVSTWIDNCGTGIMNGTGELSADGKTMTWNSTYNCPINKKPTPFRQVETITGPNTMTLEMFGVDPKSGKEYKMMVIEYTKKA
jgi:Protein of unknown function (DUF1579)